MRFTSLLIALLYLWPAWGWARHSPCLGKGCSVSATVGFKIVIPPRALTTSPTRALVALYYKKELAREKASVVIRPDGTVYVRSGNGETLSYTVARP
jgi:hypothetical protein